MTLASFDQNLVTKKIKPADFVNKDANVCKHVSPGNKLNSVVRAGISRDGNCGKRKEGRFDFTSSLTSLALYGCTFWPLTAISNLDWGKNF